MRQNKERQLKINSSKQTKLPKKNGNEMNFIANEMNFKHKFKKFKQTTKK